MSNKTNFDIPGVLQNLKISTPRFITGIIFMVSVYTLFVTVFFFTYGSMVEKEVVQNNVDLLIGDLTEDIKDIVDNSSYKDNISTIINDTNVPDLSTADEKITNNNKTIINKTIKTVGIGVIMSLFVSMILWFIFVDRKLVGFYDEIVKKSFIILVVIAIIEFCYFTFISKNYRSIDPNNVKYSIINQFKTSLNNIIITTSQKTELM